MCLAFAPVINETRSPYIAQAGLELKNLLILPSAGISDVCSYTQLLICLLMMGKDKWELTTYMYENAKMKPIILYVHFKFSF